MDHIQESRLLSLPAELRDVIWQHVLTDHHIHIRYETRSRVHWASPRTGNFYHRTLEKTRPPPNSWELTLHCKPLCSDDRLTPLWLVCKQLYNETILMPFSKTNVFSFEDHEVYKDFISGLVARSQLQMAQGIKNLWIVDDHLSGAAMEIMAPWIEESKKTSKLYDMTVYIASRIKRMEQACEQRAEGPFNTWSRMRAGWDLGPERYTVNWLNLLWGQLVQRVVIQEI